MKTLKWVFFSAVALGLSVLPSVARAGSVGVQVGYADSLRPSPFFPNNFCNGGVQFNGTGGGTCGPQQIDAGAIRIINNTGGIMTVSDVSVKINASTTLDIWNTGGVFTIADGTDEVLSQTSQFNFDTSDFGTANSPGDGFIPSVTITFTDPNVAGGAKQILTFSDTGQILNTGGFDTVNGISGTCIGGNDPTAGNTPGACNESLQWRDIGTTSFTNPGGTTPEPGSILLLLTGAGGILGFARRRYIA